MTESEAGVILDSLVMKLKNLSFAELEGEYFDEPQRLTLQGDSQTRYRASISAFPENSDCKVEITLDTLDDTEKVIATRSHFFIITEEGTITSEGTDRDGSSDGHDA